jgi:NAD(P)-dependent dehydrogenase (short-subunit alcohol dehydrogenase family)
LDVHLKGAFHVTRPAWKVMREQRYGRIVNTCSAAGILGAEGMSNYRAAKTGLIGFTRVAAAEGATHDIRVNAIAPIAYTGCWRIPSTAQPASRPSTVSLGRTTHRRRRCWMTLWANTFRSLTRHWWLRWWPFWRIGIVPFPGRSTPWAPHVARFFIGHTKGFYSPALSAEDVRDHLEEIRDEAGLHRARRTR